MEEGKFKKAGKRLFNMIKMVAPIITGVLLLIAFVNSALPKSFFSRVFTGFAFFDSFIGAALGSIAAGNPITSYIIGGELLKNNVSLVAVLAFILSWVTVGIVQFPAESLMLGKKFAFYRNLFSFISAIIISLLTVSTLWLIH